jgi:hypothetical protein
MLCRTGVLALFVACALVLGFTVPASAQSGGPFAGPGVPSYNPGVPSQSPGGTLGPGHAPRLDPRHRHTPVVPRRGCTLMYPDYLNRCGYVVLPQRRRSTMDDSFFSGFDDPR